MMQRERSLASASLGGRRTRSGRSPQKPSDSETRSGATPALHKSEPISYALVIPKSLQTTYSGRATRMSRWCWSISNRMAVTARTSGTSTIGNTKPSITASTRCLSGCCFSREFKKPLPGQGQRLEFTFTENYFICSLSGRIAE